MEDGRGLLELLLSRDDDSLSDQDQEDPQVVPEKNCPSQVVQILETPPQNELSQTETVSYSPNSHLQESDSRCIENLAVNSPSTSSSLQVTQLTYVPIICHPDNVRIDTTSNEYPMINTNPISSVLPMDIDDHHQSKSRTILPPDPHQAPMSRNDAALTLTSLRNGLKENCQIQKESNKVEKNWTTLKLPLKSIKDFDKLEQEISEDDELKTKLLNRLATIGGKTYGQHVRNGLRALMSDPIAMQFNWAGRGGKKAFQSYEIKTVLFDAVRKAFPQVTDFQLKDPVQCWLKRSRGQPITSSRSRQSHPNTSFSQTVKAV